MRHGLAAEVVVPQEEQAAYKVELARWDRDMGPDNVAEAHLVRRAAVGSITLDRSDRAREQSRQESAREAVRRWESRKQHAARRKAQDLEKDPAGVVAELEASAFGCDWLIRQWEKLEAPLRLGSGWDWLTLTRAQKLLGFPEGEPGLDAEPEVRTLWLLAGAASTRLPRLPRQAEEAHLPTEPAAARALLREFIADQVERLVELRQASWEAVEGPEQESVAVQAAAADVSKQGQLRQRYARDADRSCNAAIRLYLTIRDRRQRFLVFEAKEAASRGGVLLRAPVGGGWWREPGSDAAPPGFARLDPIPDDLAADPFAPVIAPDPGPLPAATADPGAGPPTSPTSAGPVAAEMEAEAVAGPMATDREPTADPGPSLPIVAPPPTAVASAAITPIPATDPTTPPPAGSSGAPRRSEPISPAVATGDPRRNPLEINPLQDESPVRPINDRRRTGPLPGPSRPGPSPGDRHGWRPRRR